MNFDPKEIKEPKTGKYPSREEFNILQGIVLAVLFIISVQLAALVYQSLREDTAVYQNLVNQVTSQSTKIDLLYQQCIK